MKNKKRMLFNIVFLILVFAGTVYGVFHGEDLNQIARILREVDVKWLLPAVACVVFFIWGESIIIYYLMYTLGMKLKKWTCFLFSSIGFFFSCITPSASGGQPAQIYSMKKEKIPVPVSTMILMVVTITYKLVLVVIGVGIFFFGQGFIHSYLENVRFIFYLGTALNVFCVAAMLVLAFHPVLAKAIMVKGLSWMERLHLMKHKESRMERLKASMDQYRDTAAYLKGHKRVLVNVFLITMAQRLSLFSATWFVYKSFRLSAEPAWLVITLQAIISVSVDMLPLPGGMGISEQLFLVIFLPVFGQRLLLPGMILSRGLSYYTELLLSAILTVVANFTIGRNLRIEKTGGDKMLGVYDYTVVLTYISLLVSMGGMFFSMTGHLQMGVLCLALSGLCDMFDGKIARTKKERTEEEKRFGIQIDSLCDIVCFGVGPAILCYSMGVKGIVGIALLLFYVLAGLIRLAWFNVTEESRQKETEENRECYQGVPITTASIVFPIAVVLKPLLRREFLLAIHVLLLGLGLLFITNVKIRKPKNTTLAVLVTIVAIAVLGILRVR
jgi:glycosyltransferase 2 family protein